MNIEFKYDYLIVGAGLYGATFARQMTNTGKKCLVIDRRNHIGGNIYCDKIEGINVHKYGPHIFHTDNELVWNYVNKFVKFNHFIYSPVVNYEGKLYNLPFNMNTFYQLWGVKTPEEAIAKINEQRKKYMQITSPQNLEEQALFLGGEDIYHKLIKGYTEKQWGRSAKEIPAFIIKRLPFRFTYDNNYFNHPYQGIPIGGYNKLIEGLLEGIEVRLNTNFLENKDYFSGIANKIIYTGKIDEYFNYEFGKLEYRGLHFETSILEMENFQGVAGMNFSEKEIPYTRIVEHKHFEFGTQEVTVITKEYPHEFSNDNESYYPINDLRNQSILLQYQQLAKKHSSTIFGGRLAEYKYYDMHQVISASLERFEKEINESSE